MNRLKNHLAMLALAVVTTLLGLAVFVFCLFFLPLFFLEALFMPRRVRRLP